MFGFLQGIGDVIGTVSQFAGPISNIIGAIRGNSINNLTGGAYNFNQDQNLRDRIIQRAQNVPIPESEKYAISLLKAIGQPNNSLVKEMTNEEAQGMVDAFRTAIRSQVLADRRERAMGRTGAFYNPERMDEAINYQISRGLPQMQRMAKDSAVQRLLTSAGGVGDFAGGEAAREQGGLNAMASIYSSDIMKPLIASKALSGQPQQSNILDSLGPLISAIRGGFNTGGINPYIQRY